MLLVVLFLLAMQANFFSPAKYGILPEMLPEAQLTRANGLLELSTFAAIVLGTSVGSFLFARWKGEPLIMGGMLLGIAVVGSLTSLFIRKVPASGSRLPMQWNPFGEVATGIRRIYRDRPLWLTVAGISYFWFLGALFQMAVILVGTESLHLSDTRTGLLVTALAVGIGIGSIAAGWLSGDTVEIGLVPLGAALLGLAAILLGFRAFLRIQRGLAFARGLRRRTLHRPAQRLPARTRRARRKGPLARHQQFLEYDRSGACIRRALICSTIFCVGRRRISWPPWAC